LFDCSYIVAFQMFVALLHVYRSGELSRVVPALVAAAGLTIPSGAPRIGALLLGATCVANLARNSAWDLPVGYPRRADVWFAFCSVWGTSMRGLCWSEG
jgi:hypothetical protein